MRPRIEKISVGGEASFLCRRYRSRGFGFAWHLHPEVELTWIVRGSGKRFVGDSIEGFEAGDLVLLGENLPHTWDTGGTGTRCEAVVVQFRRDFLGAEFLTRPELAGVGEMISEARRGIRFVGKGREEAARGMGEMVELAGGRRVAKLIEVLDGLARSRERQWVCSARFEVPREGEGQQRIDTVCRWISERYREEIRLEEAAGMAHLSVSAFSRFFAKSTGKTLTEYVNELRVGHACEMLVRTEESVAGVAYASGFGNLSHFNRRFLRAKGMGPREFRRAFGRGE